MTSSRIVHCFQHSERVRPLGVAEWAERREVDLRVVRVDLEPLPHVDDVERLVVLGGEMNTDQSDVFPWLTTERDWLRHAVEQRRMRIFGICLGSQLLAEACGGVVGRAAVPEIGWQRVTLTEHGRASRVFSAIGDGADVMEWHGDSWSFPQNASAHGDVVAVTSRGCATQAFSMGELVHAVQFHPEFTYERTRELVATTSDDLTPRGCIQSGEQILADPERFGRLHELCVELLDRALLG